VRTRNRKILSVAVAAVLVGGFLVVYFVRRQRAVATDETLATQILVPASGQPAFEQTAFDASDYLIVKQRVTQPDLLRPIAEQLPDSTVIDQNCGTLTVTIASDRSLTLNSEPTGTLPDTTALASKLSVVFRERAAQRAYRPGFESRTDLPLMERIPRTVIIRPSSRVTYGDVVQLMELLKDLHADPIGLQIHRLPT
jgi:hypothetical protein